MTPTVLSLIFLVAMLFRYFLVEKPKEKRNASKVYTLTRKDLSRVVQYGLVLGMLVMSVSTVFDKTIGRDGYGFVFVCVGLYLIVEVFYRKVAVPFLVRREVSSN